MPPTQLRAVAFAAAAITLWSTMASLITLTGNIPPFQLAAMTFAIGAASGLVMLRVRGGALASAFKAPLGAIALGLSGLLGYHVLYFYALQTAPPLEANVLNYLWPLLIVLFSALLPLSAGGQRLRWHHVAGAVMGFGGALIALAGPAASGPAGGTGGAGLLAAPLVAMAAAGPGHLAAFAAANVWAAYSVASRLFKGVPSISIVGICLMTAIGAALIHAAAETTTWPLTPFQWLMVVAMGLGPVGLAFTLWDEAVKHGDLRLIGVVSYATPLMSNGLLTLLGLGVTGSSMWLAVVLVTGGALLAARDTLRLPSRRPVV